MEKRQEGFATYLCMQALEKGYSFEQQMIEHNRQLMLLTVQKREGEYYFEIQDKKDFLTLFEEKTNEYKFIRTVLFGVVKCLEQLDDFLLKPDSVMLKPETIFLDADREVYLCYVPGYEGNIQQEFCAFMEYLMKYINHREDRLVVLVYGIYHIVREQQYSLLAVRKFMEEREEGEVVKAKEEALHVDGQASLAGQSVDGKADKVIAISANKEVVKEALNTTSKDNRKQIDKINETNEGMQEPFFYQQKRELFKAKKQGIIAVTTALLLLFAGISLYEAMFIYHTKAQGLALPLVAVGCMLGFLISFYKGFAIYKLRRDIHKNIVADEQESEYNRE